MVPNSSLYEYITNQKINLEASVYEYSNQRSGLIENLKGRVEQLFWLNDKYFPSEVEEKRKVRNLTLLENVSTVLPILNRFGDEIIFCNVESVTLKVLVHCFNTFFGGKCLENEYYLRKSKKQRHVQKRKQIIAHVFNCLSKVMNFESAYSHVKSPSIFSNNDVLVTQFGEDIKGEQKTERVNFSSS